MANRFDYVKYDDETAQHQEAFKNLFMAAEQMASDRLKDGRAKALVMTKLEEAYMWVGKALRDDQIARNGGADLQEQRTNS